MSEKFICEYCKGEFKSNAGLTGHQKFCELKPSNMGPEEETKLEVIVATEGDMRKAYSSTRKQLNAMEKKPIFIVPTLADKTGSKKNICLNGVVYSVPIGIHFSAEEGVPQPILDIYLESYAKTEEVNVKMKTELKKEIITIQ